MGEVKRCWRKATALWNWHVAQKSRRKLCNFLDHVHECVSRRGNKLPQVLHWGDLSPFLSPPHCILFSPRSSCDLKIRRDEEGNSGRTKHYAFVFRRGRRHPRSSSQICRYALWDTMRGAQGNEPSRFYAYNTSLHHLVD